MEIFLDTANLELIHSLSQTGLIDGVTTNPSHLAKEKKEPLALIKKICATLPEGQISVEVTEKDPAKIYLQAHKIADIAENVVVKIPCYKEYLPTIDSLMEDGIPLNITLVFSLTQAALMAKMGVEYISPFLGRLDDIDVDGIALLKDLRQIIDNKFYDSKVLAASIRSIGQVHDAILAGVDAITVSKEIFELMIDNPLTTKGMEIFDADWKKLGIKQFP